LLPYDELDAANRARLVSPLELTRRVVVKGKVKQQDGSFRSTAGAFKRFSLRVTVRTTLRATRCRPRFTMAAPGATHSNCNRASSDTNLTELTEGSFSDVNGRMSARQKFDKQARPRKDITDEFYASYLSLRAEPVANFMERRQSRWALPITSVNEDRYLRALGVSVFERNEIEGLMGGRAQSAAALHGLTGAQQSSRAVVRLAVNPPAAVGEMQRRTAAWLLRPYPLGLRFSGTNLSPLPCWLGGSQHVCLNFSDVDIAVQLHFALFRGSKGFVLKPLEMREVADEAESVGDVGAQAHDSDAFWPPPRELLQRVTLEVLSLHNLPKRGEERPRYNGIYKGRGGTCHEYHPELSGKPRPPPPDHGEPSALGLNISVHPIGGCCAVSGHLPMPTNVETEIIVRAKGDDGINAPFGAKVHCVAAEPHATFIRVGVTDGDHEVAYEVAVLGRLRGGYRVLRLRHALGTRIELAYLLVRVCFGSELNIWLTVRQMRLRHGGRSSRGAYDELLRGSSASTVASPFTLRPSAPNSQYSVSVQP